MNAVTDTIPEKANRIQVYSPLPPKDFFLEIQRGLLEQGCRLEAKEDMLFLATEGKAVGEGHTLGRMSLTVKPAATGSMASCLVEHDVSTHIGAIGPGMGGLGGARLTATNNGRWQRAYWGLSTAAWTEAFADATRLYRRGHRYVKAGVLLGDLAPSGSHQGSLFEESIDRPESRRLMQVMDRLNARLGAGTLRYAAEGIRKPWAARLERRSPRYTTRWDEIPHVRCEAI